MVPLAHVTLHGLHGLHRLKAQSTAQSGSVHARERAKAGQGSPPPTGGETTLRVEVDVALPHVAEHVVHVLQEVTAHGAVHAD